MADKTGIEWTDATWNPVTGCTEVSPGCDHCYAKTFAERWRGTEGHYFENGFDVQLRPEKLDQPLHWKRPRRIFVNSMSDLFHDSVPDEYIANVWSIMAWSPRHTYQILTKRHARMRSLLSSKQFKSQVDDYWYINGNAKGRDESPGHPYDRWPLPNVWLGVSAESHQWADIRIPALLETPAAIRFLSAEPLLGSIDLSRFLTGDCLSCGDDITDPPCGETHSRMALDDSAAGIDWVIVGGESGRGARPMHPDWARGLRDQCQAAGVAFLFKQWGEWMPAPEPECAIHMQKVGKKAAGRELDGRTWDQYPRGPWEEA